MKKYILLVMIAVVSCTKVFSQDTVKLIKSHLDPKSDRFKIVTDRAPQSVFGELLGPGILFSIHYDRRFEKRTDGFGFRVGLT